MVKKWWMTSIGYQIYPKSFYDSNNDGVGDLKGITLKLPYFKKLGINLIWICPVYDSPMDDNGYDVRDFFKINHLFGDMNDMKLLIKTAHDLDIRIVMDYVLNHTSDEHQWFLESRKSKENKYHDYYIWDDGKYINGKRVEPTNWGSFFGGSCWRYDEVADSYYMKIFSNKMPDLNWKNPEVRTAMIEVGQWWLDLGIDGFRVDAVSHLARAPFEDVIGSNDKYPLDWFKFSNLPKVHDYLKELNERLFKPNDCLAIGEIGGQPTIESAVQYAGFESNEMSMVFNFDHNWCNDLSEVIEIKDLKTNVLDLKNVLAKWQEEFKGKGWLPLNWLNHDQPRLMSQYGKLNYFKESGKMLATLMYLMRGTPFVYQGEEIGMTNYPFASVDEFDDISSINYYKYLVEERKEDPSVAIKKVRIRSRDNARTPLQWNRDIYAGFSKTKPWLPVNPNYQDINIEDQIKDPSSIWRYYQKLFELRSNSIYSDLIIYGDIKILDRDDHQKITYLRTNEQYQLLVINSFSKDIEYYNLDAYEVKQIILSNTDKNELVDKDLHLAPYGSVVIEVKELL